MIVDVLVVGAGACGLAAAIAAADEGASVAILEKLGRPGGNSALSTGSVPAAGSRFQRDAGIDDSPAKLVADLRAISGESDHPELLVRLAELSAPTVEWLIDDVGCRMQLVTAYKHIGHSVPRLHAPVSRRGRDLVDDLLAAVDRRGIPLATGNKVTRLVGDANGITGVEIELRGGVRETAAAGKVILAVNGYAGDKALVERFCPDIAGARYFGALGSTGEAIHWGEELGAGLGNMAAYQGYAAVADPHGSLLSWTTIEKGGVLVNAAGHRFGDESAGYSGFTPNVMAAGPGCAAIFDQHIFDVASLEEEFRELANYGGFKRGDTIEVAAQAAGFNPAIVAAEIAAYNDAACGKQQDVHGRRDFGRAPLTGPFYVCRVVPGLFHTQGGLMIDSAARVLRKDGQPIPNLFAGGGAAVGISGKHGAAGYASGNGLLTAIALGRIAGLTAARELGAQRKSS
jgi:fumarate reductase flavoprotein subunit